MSACNPCALTVREDCYKDECEMFLHLVQLIPWFVGTGIGDKGPSYEMRNVRKPSEHRGVIFKVYIFIYLRQHNFSQMYLLNGNEILK